jgi:hypothetical protein
MLNNDNLQNMDLSKYPDSRMLEQFPLGNYLIKLDQRAWTENARAIS